MEPMGAGIALLLFSVGAGSFTRAHWWIQARKKNLLAPRGQRSRITLGLCSFDRCSCPVV